MILDDMNKSRQMMLKTTAPARLAQHRGDTSVCTDQRSVASLAALDAQGYPACFVATNSNYGNQLIPVFPRVDLEKPPPLNSEEPPASSFPSSLAPGTSSSSSTPGPSTLPSSSAPPTSPATGQL